MKYTQGEMVISKSKKGACEPCTPLFPPLIYKTQRWCGSFRLIIITSFSSCFLTKFVELRLKWPTFSDQRRCSSSSSSSSSPSSEIPRLAIWICWVIKFPVGRSWWTGLVMERTSSPPSSSPAEFSATSTKLPSIPFQSQVLFFFLTFFL